jgi:hypothetical protein
LNEYLLELSGWWEQKTPLHKFSGDDAQMQEVDASKFQTGMQAACIAIACRLQMPACDGNATSITTVM